MTSLDNYRQNMAENNEENSVSESLKKKLKINKLYKDLPENLTFQQSFTQSGKQGVLGILHDEKNKYVYKISQYMNFLVDQEHIILKSLEKLKPFCPHFVNGVGKFKVLMNSDFRKMENPFKLSTRHNIYNDVLLMKYIDKARKFYRYIKNEKIEEEVLYSIVKQTLLALSISQKNNNLTHYDLHSNNVLIKLCDPNSVFLYVIDQHKQYCVPTYGYYPVVIDFGFGYVKEMEDKPLFGALAHTDVGFMTNKFDKFADPKLFLVTVSDEIKSYRGSKKSKKFRNLIKNIFEPLNIDWISGWDLGEDQNCSDQVYQLVKREGKFSAFFREYGHYCIDILQRLITLPLKKKKYSDIEDIYSMMVNEFYKIESEIGSKFYILYIFKCTVEAASQVKDEYSNEKTMNEAVRKFKHSVLNSISTIAKYCHPKLDWDKLLCSMLMFSRQMEGVLYENLTPKIISKEKMYEKMELKDIDEIYESVEYNIPAHFNFDKNTKVYVWDALRKTSTQITLPKLLIEKINKKIPLERGKLIYRYYLNETD
jgi:hypothetical protein